jgi:hypothetical protein
MPGAVPILMPLSAPPIPTGGTLVSSATQAGKPPPAVKPVLGPYGATGLDGLAAQSVHGFGTGAPSFIGQGAQISFAGPDERTSHGPGAFGPVYTADVTDQVSGPRTTKMMRYPTRSRLPLVVLLVVGAAGAVGGVWLGISRDGIATLTKDVPAEPAGAAQPTGQMPKPSEDPASEPGKTAEPGKIEPPAVAEPPAIADDPTKPSEPGKAAEPPTVAADPARSAEPGTADPAKLAPPPVKPAEPPAKAVDPTDDAKPDLPTTKQAKVVGQEPRPKAAKPKRAERRPRKAETKEQTWNADSPFLPETTPKH